MARRCRDLGEEWAQLPESFAGDVDYDMARTVALEHLATAMKHAMRADAFTNRGERDEAATSWRAHRAAYRRARVCLDAARVYQSIPPEQRE
jgi:hypothetical protein